MADTPVGTPVGLVSAGSAGVEGNGASSSPVFSPDGRQVVFVSSASNLVAGDTDTVQDVFIKSLTGAIQLVSFDSVTGLKGNGNSYNPVFSPDGTKVAFSSLSTNFSADANGQYGYDIFVKDLVTGRVTLASAAADGTPSNNNNQTPVFSPDSTKVLFYSAATNLTPADPNNSGDLFIKDLTTQQVTLVSTNAAGLHGVSFGYSASFSPDGTKVVFTSATAFTADDTNRRDDVFVKDLTSGAITLVSRNAAGVEGNNASSSNPVFSPDGTKVAFGSTATNLVTPGTAAGTNLFVKDITSPTGAVTLVSANAAGVQADKTSFDPSFSPDGAKILFDSYATNLVTGDTNGQPDIFVKDLTTGAVTLISTNAAGTEGNALSRYAAFSPDGTKITWQSNASNLVPGDTNGASDVFVASFPLPAPNTAPTVSGAVAGQAVTDKTTVRPLSTVTVVDPDVGQTETVTVTYTAANGMLAGGGFTGSAGSYSASFTSAAAAQAALQALVFTPAADQVTPGSTVTTGFTIGVGDGQATATNTGASVIAASINDAPTVSGALAGQADAAGVAIRPFSTVTVADPDVGQTETVTVSFAAANGTLSGGGFAGSNGVYTVFGTAAQVTADLQAAAFIPTAAQSASTTLTIAVSDGTATTTNATTSVVATYTPPPPVNTAPTVSGAVAGQADPAGVAIRPFSTITIADPDVGQTETVTVSFAAANGTLSGGGFIQTAPGVYSVTAPAGAAGASAAAAQADLRAAVFTPTAGQSATTGFAVSVSDGQMTATDSTASVVATYTPPPSGGGGGTVITPTSVQYGLLTEFQNLERALANGADALTPATPVYAAFQAEKVVAAQLDNGQVFLAQAETALAHLVDGTTAVAVASYGFFTGSTPTAAGLNYLVHSTANATDLNDAYYARFSTENRYINFAVNLATGPGAGAAAFQVNYGALSLADATTKAYAAVFGAPADAAKVSALLDTLVPDGLGGQETRAQYFAQYGGDGPNGQGTKAAMIGFLLSNAVHDGSGVYGAATENYLSALAHGVAPALGSELALHYGATVSLVGATPSADPTVTG